MSRKASLLDAGEQRGLIAASASGDLEDGVLLVGSVLGQERQLQLTGEHVEPCLAGAALLVGQLAHLGIEGGIAQHPVMCAREV